MQTAKTLIRLGGCPDGSGPSLGAQVILFVLSCGGSYDKQNLTLMIILYDIYETHQTLVS